MVQKYIRLSPLVKNSLTTSYIENGIKYKTFAPSQIYEVDKKVLEQLRVSTTLLYTIDKEEKALLKKIDYKKEEFGCSPCRKKKGLQPLFVHRVATFIEVDSQGKILESKLLS